MSVKYFCDRCEQEVPKTDRADTTTMYNVTLSGHRVAVGMTTKYYCRACVIAILLNGKLSPA